MDNLQAALDAPTALNVTVQATRRRRLAPNRGLTTVVGGDSAECHARLKEIEAAGGLSDRVRFIVTGVKRAESFGRG